MLDFLVDFVLSAIGVMIGLTGLICLGYYACYLLLFILEPSLIVQ